MAENSFNIFFNVMTTSEKTSYAIQPWFPEGLLKTGTDISEAKNILNYVWATGEKSLTVDVVLGIAVKKFLISKNN